MAKHGLSYDSLAEQTGLDQRTLRGIMRAETRPHAKTLQRLAEGLGVGVDELFAGDESAAHHEFDSQTNPAIEEAVSQEPGMFARWTPADFGELASRFGAGGPLTVEGVIESAQAMNANRETLARAQVVLESTQAQTLREVVEALYRQVRLEE